jgi:serine/threonine-protein kinase
MSRYELRGTLGRGGMATVYRAHDPVLGREVALKVLAAHFAEDESFRARFLREAKLAARVTHPNVVQIYDAGVDERGPFIAMELVEGESLGEELARRGRLHPEEVVSLGLQLCGALEATHAAGLVHRDVKPQNVLLTFDRAAKLGDFGIARSEDATRLTEHGSVLGTAAYLAPEQARGGAVTPATDLYGLGVLLYESLTGRRPHEGATLSELVLAREREPARPPSDHVAGVPVALDAAILGCLALRPEDRTQSAAALAGELAYTLAGADTATAATRLMPAASTRGRRGLAAAAVLVLAALGLGAALALNDGSGTATPRAVRTTAARTTAATPVVHRPATTATPPPTTAPAVVHPQVVARCDTAEAEHRALESTKDEPKGRKHDHSSKADKKALEQRKHALERELKSCR